MEPLVTLGRLSRRVSISKSTQEKSTDNDHFIQTRVSFITHNTRQQVNETLLHRIFSRFGEVADCVVKQYEIAHQPRAKQCGYAYVYFFDITAAKRAISSLSGDRREEIESIRMDCKLSLESAQKLQDILSLDDRSTGSQSTQPLHGGAPKSVSPVLLTKSGDDDRCLSVSNAPCRLSDVSSISSPVSMHAECFAPCQPLEPHAVPFAHHHHAHAMAPNVSSLPVPPAHFTTQRMSVHPAIVPLPLPQALPPPAMLQAMPMHMQQMRTGMQQLPPMSAHAQQFAPAPFVLPPPANAPQGAMRPAVQPAGAAPVYMVYPPMQHMHQPPPALHAPYGVQQHQQQPLAHHAPQLRQQFSLPQQPPMLVSLAIRQ